jgi:hypothetical protein
VPTVTLKVSDDVRAAWQLAADRESDGNLSEWLRSVADERASGAPTVVRTLPVERTTRAVRRFRGMDAKDKPLRP